MPMFRKKVPVKAEQYTGPAFIPAGDLTPPAPAGVRFRAVPDNPIDGRPGAIPCLMTLEGEHDLRTGDWIITNPSGNRHNCSAEEFAATYEPAGETPTAGQSFGWALKQLQNGARVQRDGWNGKGMHLYLEDGLAVEVPAGAFKGSMREYEPFLVLFNAQGKHQPGWAPSPPDMLATDWRLVSAPEVDDPVQRGGPPPKGAFASL